MGEEKKGLFFLGLGKKEDEKEHQSDFEDHMLSIVSDVFVLSISVNDVFPK